MTTTKPEMTIPEVKLKVDRLVAFGNTGGSGGSDGVREWSLQLISYHNGSGPTRGGNMSSDVLSLPHTLGIIEAINNLEAEFAQISAKKREALDEIVPWNETYHALEIEARVYGEVAERIRAALGTHGVYQDLPILPYQR